MRNKAFEVEVPAKLWSDLSFALMRSNDTRKVDEVVAIAIKHYRPATLPNRLGAAINGKRCFYQKAPICECGIGSNGTTPR